MRKRKLKDNIANITTYIFSVLGLITLISIMCYVFINGSKNLSWKFLTSNYQEVTYNLQRKDLENYNLDIYNYQHKKDEYYSKKWGIALKDSQNASGNKVIEITFINNDSPLNNMINLANNSFYKINVGEYIDKIVVSNENDSYYALSKDGAENMINQLEQGNKIDDMVLKVGGGGIKGSILTTLYLIILTLIIALPLGIGCAIYLNEYASKNKFLTLLHSLIDMLGGIPSIIFGFFGMFIFIPFCDLSFHTNGGSIISGSLTLAVMLLPTIIKNVEESLYVIPNSYRSASLALGASKSQTIFKIILPNSLSGILTATVLSIGRVIGESASLIFALGTAIKDSIKLTGNGTSLAVHIWVLMGGEEPNFDASCAIAIVILIIVLLLNLFVKLIERKLSKYA